ncbi:MAG: RsmG family class I SAM-dependent methyltransferase [Candidatus Poriferisodalaceae bacterium]
MSSRQLAELLERAQNLGHIGPGEIDSYVKHSISHLSVADPAPGSRWCDLGSGGGLPGLIVAVERPDLKLTLLDRSSTRVEFLAEAVNQLDVGANLEVVEGDATVLAHNGLYRGEFDGVFCRSFGPPSITAECAIGFLCKTGCLVVSEPPTASTRRWSLKSLQTLGFAGVEMIDGPPRFAKLAVATPPGPDVPRTWKQMTKKPLF